MINTEKHAAVAAAPSPEGQEADGIWLCEKCQSRQTYFTRFCRNCNGDYTLSRDRPAPAEGQAGDEWRPHPDDLAVDRMAAAMKEKLAKKREQGRGGWEDKEQCSAEYLSQLLIEHVAKGDPIDVANFAMMLHQRGERITAAAQPAPGATHPSAEPVGTVRFALGVPSSLYGELDVPLEPGTKLYARPVPSPADEAVRLLADIKAWDVSQYLSLPLHLRKRIQAALAQQQPAAPSGEAGAFDANFLQSVASLCRAAYDLCQPKPQRTPEDPREHYGELCLLELTSIADEIERRLAAAVLADREAQQQDKLDAARWRYIRRKLCLTGNGDGTCAMQAINLPAAIQGWPEPGQVAEFCDAAIDHARRIDGDGE